MTKLLISADIHGLYSGWQIILAQLGEKDVLAIAGDLCGTRFPKPDDPDYQPAQIMTEFRDLKNEKHLIYGNCDIPHFFPGLMHSERFEYAGKNILLVHGDTEYEDKDFDIVIFGHTHVPFLKQDNGKVYLNPGSPSKPRGFIGKDLLFTYADFDGKKVRIINSKTGGQINQLEL